MKRSADKTRSREDRELFISRDLSWIDFNSRVLFEAGLTANPLLERVKFLAITGGNLDEFFMVRIAGLRQLMRSGNDFPDPAGNTAEKQLAKARRKIQHLIRRQSECLLDELLPELERHGIYLRRPDELPPELRKRLRGFFAEQIMPVLTPLAVDNTHPFPVLNSGAIEIALELRGHGRKPLRAFVEVPEVLPRFIPVADAPGRTFVLLEELVMDNLEALFPGAKVEDRFAFRLTRDMDNVLDDESFDDLLHHIGRKLLQRRQREPIRLELPQGKRGELLKWLHGELKVDPQFCYAVRGPLYLKQFSELAAAARAPELLEKPWPPAPVPELAGATDVFEAVSRHRSILIAPPYQDFDALVSLLERAAEDPDVLAIKQTLYRVSGNSPVVRALRRAAENGKQVTVLLELKARFDEGNNIAWARLLDESGAHVVYGVARMKVHCKALLIVRREAGGIRRYVHLGTGNYNDKTAKLYTDLGLISCDEDLGFDVSALFNVLTGSTTPPARWRKLAVSPFDLRERLEELIEREIKHARSGGGGRIVAKMNSLSDERMVRLLHRAADAGVEIDLIVRGISCCRPRPQQENLRIVSIVDRYLEHSRVFYFRNLGAEEFYLSSADLMSRNLDRRIEAMFPVEDPRLREMLRALLKFQLEDLDKARRLQAGGIYTRPAPAAYGPSRSQYRSWRFFQERAERETRRPRGILRIFRSGSGD